MNDNKGRVGTWKIDTKIQMFGAKGM